MKNKFFQKLSIHVTIGILLLLSAFFLPLGYYIISSQRALLLSNLETNGKSLAELIAEASAAPIEKFSFFRLEELALKVERPSDVAYCEIFDIEGTSLVKSENILSKAQVHKKKRVSGKNIQRFTSDIRNTQRILGWVEIGIYLDPVNTKIKTRTIQLLIVFVFVLIFVAISINLFLYKSFISPVIRLSHATKSLAQGDFITMEAIRRQDEIGELFQRFNYMSIYLKNLYQTLETKVRERTQKLELMNQTLKTEVAVRQKTETKLKAAMEAAEMANKYKSIFVANISHEIRTPLNVIMGYTQILKRWKTLDEDVFKAVDTIEKSGNHLLTVINDILDLSKIEAGKLEINRTEFNLNALVIDLTRMFEMRCREKGLSWTCETSIPTEDLCVAGDEGKLRQVLINLLGNAIKFTNRGGVILRIDSLGHHAFRFEVEDSGVGISARSKDMIFEPFGQVDSESYLGGTGLGLSISKRYTQLMGGTLEFSSETGSGSRFFFTIDLEPVSHRLQNDMELTYHDITSIKGDPLTALIVDDDPRNREIVSMMLSHIGVTVIETNNAAEAIETLSSRAVDIVFMDRYMPVTDGIEASRQIRDQHSSSEVKIVLITADVFEKDTENLSTAGIDKILHKPYKFDAIYECLHDLLGVTFEYREKGLSRERKHEAERDPKTFYELELPDGLLSEISNDAEYCKISQLKAKLSELDNIGGKAAELSRVLSDFLKMYHMDQIVDYVKRIQKTGS